MKNILAFYFFCCVFVCANSQNISYKSGNNGWNEDSLGNHRVVVQFTGDGKVAKAVINWRRNDTDPEKKRIIVQDAVSQKKILNVKTVSVNNETGEIYFEPVSGKGTYYIYYMPYRNEGRSNYPKGVYLPVENTAADNWLQTIPKTIATNTIVKEIQSINEFDSFYPMEVIATAKETEAVIAKSKRTDYLVFTEDRIYPIKMQNRLAQRWIQKTSPATFSGMAAKGENYTYQLGIYALTESGRSNGKLQ